MPDRQLLKPLQIVTKQGKGRAAGQAVQQTPCNRIAGEQNAGLPVEQEDASHRMTGNRDHIQNPSAEIKLHSIRHIAQLRTLFRKLCTGQCAKREIPVCPI